MSLVAFVLLLIATAALSAALIIFLKPLLFRYALARPDARSSHKEPTPQGAGIAVIAAALAGALLINSLARGVTPFDGAPSLLAFCGAALALAAIGMIDDIAPLSPSVRVVGQAGAAIALLLALPAGARALPSLPWLVEAAVCVVGLVWFVNLTNFMDGIDGMIVAGILPMLTGCALLASNDQAWPAIQPVIALALAAALIGFAPFNRPIAQVFLGDVGSLAIGGVTGWLLLDLATTGRLASALILALYFLTDTSTTLVPALAPWRKAIAGTSRAFLPARYHQRLDGRRGDEPRALGWQRPVGDRSDGWKHAIAGGATGRIGPGHAARG